MKKLVYAFAVIMAVSFASCKTDDGSNSAEQAEEPAVENVEGGDSITDKANDSININPAQEVKNDSAPAQEAAPEAPAKEEAAK